MAEVIIMPKLGFNMSEGKLMHWYKKEGEDISKGEALFSIETDKTSIDIEATGNGVVLKLLIAEGDVIPVTLPIAVIGNREEDITHLLKDAFQQLGRGELEIQDNTKRPTEKEKNEIGLSQYDFDIAVIGGGPGGYVAAIKAAQSGKKTVIIEKNKMGGTCLNVGCIPTKTLLRSAEALKEVKESAVFGVSCVDVSNAKLNMVKVQERKSSVVNQLVGGVNGLLRGNGVTIITTEASLVDRHTIQAGDQKLTAANIIIATGSVSKSLPITIHPDMKVLTSTELLDLDSIPERIAIIGGGVIGIEFAYFLSLLGSKVTVVEYMDRILPMIDEEITNQVTDMLRKMGVMIQTGAKVTEITADSVLYEKDGQPERVEVDQVLMAVGRTPDMTGISCEEVGIKTERSAIVTDHTLRTSVDNIYAVGDVNGKAMLAHVASMEAVVAVENICGHTVEMDYDRVPSAIYLQPEIASVGLTEEQAKKKYGSVKVGKFPLLANGKAKVSGEEQGLVKVITEARYGEIVGVHLYCIHATDMIAEAVVAMKLEGTAEEICGAMHPHPTVSEVIHEAFNAAIDKAIHFI